MDLENPSELDLTVYWYLDGELVGEGLTYEFIGNEIGFYTLMARTAGEYHLSGASLLICEAEEHTWNIEVRDDTDPTAIISLPKNGDRFYVGDEITFDGSSSYDLESSILMEWDMGDGTTSSQEIFTYVFYSEGDHTISLTVVDSLGQIDT